MPHQTYLAFHRKRHAVSKREIAQLLAVDRSVVSRVERGERHPSIHLALGLEVIFGKSPRELFPDLYRMIEEAVINRAAEFEKHLAGKSGKDAESQRALLLKMVERGQPTPAQP